MKLVIFDANVIIYLAGLKKLKSLFSVCTIYMTETIYSECKFYIDNETGDKKLIDLQKYKESKKLIVKGIDVEDMLNADIHNTVELFKKRYDIHRGEEEAIYYIHDNPEYKFCAGDAAAYKLLGYLNMQENAISLEQVIGRLSNMEIQYTEEFMKNNIQLGLTMMIENGEF